MISEFLCPIFELRMKMGPHRVRCSRANKAVKSFISRQFLDLEIQFYKTFFSSSLMLQLNVLESVFTGMVFSRWTPFAGKARAYL